MKISKRDINILLIFLGVLIVILAFFYGFQPLQEKNEQIVQEITTLRGELTKLQALAAKEDYYRTSTEDMEKKAEEIFNQFPADIKTEDCIMYAMELEGDTQADITTVTFAPNNLAYTWGQGAVNTEAEETTDTGTSTSSNETAETASTAETADASTETNPTTADANAATTNTAVAAANNKQLFETKMTLEYNATYKALKELINYIHNDQNRRTLQTLEVSYDSETGNLTGSVEMGMFSLTGLNKAYQEPNIPSMTIGTDNIFGTVEVPSNTDENNSEENKEENTQENTQN